jgi:hypothetical protein
MIVLHQRLQICHQFHVCPILQLHDNARALCRQGMYRLPTNSHSCHIVSNLMAPYKVHMIVLHA